jgi:hypothetical protein
MTPDHTGTRIAHHDPRLLPLHALVAVDRAPGTGGFFLSIRALEESFLRVSQEFLAFSARGRSGAWMVIAAVKANHRLERPVLPAKPGFGLYHGRKHTAVSAFSV